MRCLACLALVLHFQVAVAGVFRVAELGGSCSSIPDREIGAGSHQIPWKVDEPGFIAFRTRLMGEEVTVVYLCRNGLLATENYFFPQRQFDASLEEFRKVYDALTARFGAAWLDNTPWQSDADPRWVVKDPRKYYVTWRNPEVRINIAIMPRDFTQVSQHHVLLIVSTSDL